ncbi:MAG TPA: hypothetical protein VHQ64_14885 [Pyrinomonadaceae bacterium]|jgi:hypothetical protein|nr:hypothetical protein [Pyrinomonadaceae bacterium]
MNANFCRDVRREIDQSELRQSLSAGSEAHLVSCAACKTFHDERLHLRALVGGLQPVTAPADFEMRLRARIARERVLPKQPFIFRVLMSTPAIVVTAVVVIVVAAIVFFSQRNRPQAPSLAGTNNQQTVQNPQPVVAREQMPEPTSTISPLKQDRDKPRQSPMIVRNAPKSNLPVNVLPPATDSTVGSAKSVHMIDRNGEVTLAAPLKPMVVTVYDEHGNTRKIQLPPISFGSQRLTNNRAQVSMTNTKDW